MLPVNSAPLNKDKAQGQRVQHFHMNQIQQEKIQIEAQPFWSWFISGKRTTRGFDPASLLGILLVHLRSLRVANLSLGSHRWAEEGSGAAPTKINTRRDGERVSLSIAQTESLKKKPTTKNPHPSPSCVAAWRLANGLMKSLLALRELVEPPFPTPLSKLLVWP